MAQHHTLADAQILDKWDARFLELAQLVARWSKDPSTQVGAVLAADKRVITLGFNGFPSGMDDALLAEDTREAKYSRTIHAEMNALMFARAGVPAGTTCYVTLPICDRCQVHLLQAGVRRFVMPRPTEDTTARWSGSWALAADYRRELGAVTLWV